MVRASGSQDGEPGISIPLQYNDDHWRDIFKKYDRDGDGKISYLELKAMIRGDEYTHDIPLCVARTIMKRADLDNSGYLEFPEFIAMIHRKDMQGVFGHLVQRYVHSVVPGRPIPPSMSQQQRTRDLPDGLYEEEYSCRPPPVAMIIISTLEILLFLYDAVAHRAVSVEGPAATLLIYNPHKRNEIWRYVTYMFVHVGAFHLLVNLSVQVLLGLPLEMVHRWWRVLIIYLAGVLAGSLGTSVSDPSVHLAGASGGVYALITAHVATIILNWKQMEYALLQSFIFVSVAVLDVGQAIWRRYVTEVDDNVGYVAHIAGALAGLLVGINILRNLEVKTWEKVVWWLSIFTYTALMVAAILWNVLNISYYEKI